jgi:flagellin-like protein
MVSKLNHFIKKRGVSPVIGVILLVAVVVALVVLASVIVFNIGGDSDGTSADASIDFKQTSSGVSVQVVSNNNVEEFKILSPDGKENRVSGNVGSSTSIIGVDGTYTVIAIMPDGEEQVLATKTVEGLDYSGVFVVLQDEEEGEVNATLSQQFDNVEDYDLSLQTNNNGDEEVALNSFGYETQQNLLSEQLVQESPSLGEKIALIRITSNRDIETIKMDKFGDSNGSIKSDVAYVGDVIQVHKMANLCPGDELILEESSTNDELASETITVSQDCGELRKIARYLDGEITAAEIINLWNLELDYFVFQYDGQPQPELPTSPVPTDETNGVSVKATVLNQSDNTTIEGATVALGAKTNTTNSTGVATFEDIDPGVEIQTQGNNIDAVAYRDGYKPSPVRTIPIDDNWTNPQEEKFELEPYTRQAPTRSSKPAIQSGGSATYNFSGSGYSGGGAVISSGSGGGGSFTGGTISGGGSFYSGGGESPTTFSRSTPVKKPDYEFVQPERIFNVIDIDESLIPTDEDFLVRTSLKTTGTETISDTVKVYAVKTDTSTSTSGIDDTPMTNSGGGDLIGSSNVTIPSGGEVVTNEQELSIPQIGEYDVYIYLEGSDEYKPAGTLDVFNSARENAILEYTGEYEISPENANTGEEVTVEVTGEDITVPSGTTKKPSTVTVDIFKNGIRVKEGEVDFGEGTSTLTYTETFENPQYVQFHAGIQESQDVGIMGTTVITDSAVGTDLMEAFNTSIKIDNSSLEECTLTDSNGDEIRTSGQFDCEVETDTTELTFNGSNSTYNFDDLDNSSVDEIELTWVLGDEDSVTNTYTTDKEINNFITNDGITNTTASEFSTSHKFKNDTIHMVELRADVTIDGTEYGSRDALFVNALDNPGEDMTRITGTTVTGDSEVNVNIMNPRETVTEDVTVEYINKTGISQFNDIESEDESEDDIIYADDVSVKPEQSVLLTRTLNGSEMKYFTNQTLEGGDTVEFWVRLSHTDTSMDNDFYATVDVTVPESSIDATIEGTVEICESSCN